MESRRYDGVAGLIRTINGRMLLMPRADDFDLPWCNGTYIPDIPKAKEHRNAMQVLSFMVAGIDDDLTELCIM